jgi:hypothetical protein
VPRDQWANENIDSTLSYLAKAVDKNEEQQQQKTEEQIYNI